MSACTLRRAGTVFIVLTALLLVLPVGGAAVEILPINVSDASWTFSQASDVNSKGHVVGVWTDGVQVTGFLYRNGTVQDLCPPSWSDCLAASISDSGMVGGFGNSGAGVEGFTYSGGSYTPVTAPTATATFIAAVNESGDLAGYAVVLGNTVGYRRVNGAFTVFSLPSGYTSMRARDINSNGDVVGTGVSGGSDIAFAFIDSIVTDPAPPGWTDTSAKAINDNGDIIGVGDSGGVTRCWRNRGGAFTIILPPGWESSRCSDINNSGDIIGDGVDESGGNGRFVYRKGRYHFIEDLFGVTAISDSGYIAGVTTDDFISIRAMAGLLLPEPEIKANGDDGPFVLPPGKSLTLKAALAVFGLLGRTSDWWIFAQTPAGPFTFDIASLRWVPGFRPAAVMPLRDVPNAKLPPAGTARGLYTYFLGVDLIPNGRVDVRYLLTDRVIVFVR